MRTRQAAGTLLVTAGLLLAVELAARRLPVDDPDGAERNLVALAGRRPVVVCRGGECRTDPELVALSNPDLRFAETPPPGTFRVACVGGSTTAGWPFQPRGGYPEWLGQVLADALPGRRTEALNLGVNAWDGSRLEPVFEQALSLRPSAVLVRVGYNYHRHALMRRPRGGPLRRALQRAWLFLYARSAAFRRACRLAGPRERDPALFEPPQRLTPEEHRWIVEDHRARLRAFAARARAAGVPLLVLGLPYRESPPSLADYLGQLDLLQEATREECRALGVPFVPLAELHRSDRFIDFIHSDLGGYRATALAAARALAAAGLPEPGARWRWERLASRAAHERRLGLDEPEYRAHLELRLALGFLAMGRPNVAAAHMEAALLAAPNPDLVPAAVAGDGRPAVAQLYRECFARLRQGRLVPEPTQAPHRALAGLPPPQKL